MPHKCGACHCSSKSGPADKGNIRFFNVPKVPELRQKWEAVLLKEGGAFNNRSKVCSKHFSDEDILKAWTHNIDSTPVIIERDRWSLKPHALPALFLANQPAPESANRDSQENTAEGGLSLEDVPTLEDELLTIPDNSAPAANNNLTRLQAEITQQTELHGWSVHSLDVNTVALCQLSIKQSVVVVAKAVTVPSCGPVIINFGGRVVPHDGLPCSGEVADIQDLVELLRCLDKLKPCTGYAKSSTAMNSVCSQCDSLYSKSCAVTTHGKMCLQCKKQKKAVKKKANSHKLPSRLLARKALQKKLSRAKAAKQKAVAKKRSKKQDIPKAGREAIDSVVRKLPVPQQMAFHAAHQALEKSRKGIRYQRQWLMNCLLLRIASPKAYKLIAKMKLLQLPSLNRLRQILKGMPCEFGFSEMALKSIEMQFQGENGYKCYGTLILDEMKVRKAIQFDQSKYRLEGFVDYGEDSVEKEPADHALVFMFVPLFANWVQPIASFATKGAAPGEVLAQLVIESVIELHKHNATVIAVVSDGAGNNKAMWTRLGISGRLMTATNKVPHPCIPGQHLHFLCDTPHMVKCIRNHLHKHNTAQAGDLEIKYDHYRILYKQEEDKQLRVVPKLTQAHVEPDSLRKMNVRLATQLFSRGTALGIEFYRRQGLPGLEDSEGTEAFTQQVNDLFDVLNAKVPKEAIRPGSSKRQVPPIASKRLQCTKELVNLAAVYNLKVEAMSHVIANFLITLDKTERRFCRTRERMFASLQTIQSLRVSLMSTQDILAKLFTEGVSYALTAKLNQDPLERFFGSVRSFGGHEDHPTIVNFARIFRLMTIYTPIKVAIKGNIEDGDTDVLPALADSLEAFARDRDSSEEMLHARVEQKLHELCFDSARATLTDHPGTSHDHDNTRVSVEDYIAYYLAGYLVHKFTKHKECSECLSDIQTDTPSAPEASLTFARSFKELSLKHPTQKMFSFLKVIEETVANALFEFQLCSDIFWAVLDALEESKFPMLGCSAHKDKFTPRVLKAYILLRLHFFARDMSKMLSKSEETSRARKRAKLV